MNIFLDLGAYNGDSLTKALQDYPDFDLFVAFEPFEPNINILKENFGEHPKVTIEPVACSTKNGTADFYLHKDIAKKEGTPHVGNSLTTKKTNINKSKHVTVQTIDFAQYVKDNFKLEDTLILKIDIEGTEYDLLEHLIEQQVIQYFDKIFCEWHVRKMYPPMNGKHNELVGRLQVLGFDLTGDATKDQYYHESI